jgi:SpoVK/Ycf46/Vps4 family AAA+-type ATPase
MEKANRTESRAFRELWQIFQSGRPLTYIHSIEEERVGRLLREAGLKLFEPPPPVWTWSLTSGLRRENEAAEAETQDPRKALDFIAAHSGGAIFHMKDFHEPLRESAEVRRRLRDVYESCRDAHKFVVITSPVRLIPEELERSAIVMELRPPDQAELAEVLREEVGTDAGDDATLLHLAGPLLGLTLDEARFAMRRARSQSGQALPPLPALLEEKRLLVSRSGVIEYVAEGADIGEIGGLDGLKKWLLERRNLFQARDTLSAEIVPKGVLMMGIPGCGKSLSVKAIASAFQLPLYRIDMIEIFSGRHGKPEGAFVQACRMMEDIAPAVLWFDEIEMGVTSAESGGEQGRIFAFFLTWMQEKPRGLFVAATANRIDLLPAEMIRKGRFDEVFFVDLPLEEERIEIFKIHLTRRGVDVAAFDLGKLTQFTKGWAGAEIEQCVISAITKARLEQRLVSEEDLIRVAAKIVPLSRTMNEQVNHIRSWAFERAMRASTNS